MLNAIGRVELWLHEVVQIDEIHVQLSFVCAFDFAGSSAAHYFHGRTEDRLSEYTAFDLR